MAYATHPCTHNAPALLCAESGRAGLNVVAAAAAGLRGGCSECCGLRLVAAAQLGGALRRRRWLTRMCIDGKAPLHLIPTAAAWGKRERWRVRERGSDRIEGGKEKWREGGREGKR